MKKMLRVMVMVPVLVLLVAGVSGCKEKGPMEKAGENIDKAAEKAGDAVKEGVDKAKEAVK